MRIALAAFLSALAALPGPASAQSAWNLLAPSGTPPSARFAHTAIIDAPGDRMIVYGGRNQYMFGSEFAEVWALALDGSNWSQLSPAGGPPAARASHSAIYHPSRQQMVVYGGSWGERVSYAILGDLWALELSGSPVWSALPSGGARPSPRAEHTAILDPVRDRMVVFGGLRFTSSPTDSLFAYDFLRGTWSELSPTGPAPSPRWGHAALYDASRRRMLVFGGLDGSGLVADSSVWALSLDDPMEWTRLADAAAVPGLPGTCAYQGLIADVDRDRMLLYGGIFTNTRVAEYPLAGGAWAALSPSGGPPAGRDQSSTVVDTSRHRAIIFAGVGAGPTFLNDAWSLALDHATPVLASLVETSSDSRGLHLAWHAPGLEAANVSVERASTGEPHLWTTLGQPRGAGSERLAFDDATVQPGQSYGYRLVSNARGERSVYATDWVTVPARIALALAATPNPATGAFGVRCDLPDGSAARLEVLDVTWRVVRAMDLAESPVGARTLRFRIDGAETPGVYFLRLRQGSSVRVQRVSVAR